MRTVAILALDGVVAFDLTIPCQVFAAARLADGKPAYRIRVCVDRSVTTTACEQEPFRISSPYGWEDILDADTVIVPGVDPDQPAHPRAVSLIRQAAARGARVASICTGAFVLAAAGLLDGRRATTHWQLADRLAAEHPEIDVDPLVLFVDEGAVLTSAGVAAGVDLCLHLVRRDHGAAVAADTGRAIVMAPQRSGGQAQFIGHRPASGDPGDLGPTLEWIQEHLDAPLSVADIAGRAAMSRRNLARRFRAHTGATPMQWLLARRIERARELLETTDLTVDRIARAAGFGSTETLRHHFGRQVGGPPSLYRATFREPPPTARGLAA